MNPALKNWFGVFLMICLFAIWIALLSGCAMYLPNCTHYKCVVVAAPVGGDLLLEGPTGASMSPATEVKASLK